MSIHEELEMKSLISVEVSLTKKIIICSPVNEITNDSLMYIQKQTIPNYLQSIDFDTTKFIISSKVVEIEVDKEIDNPIEIIPNKLIWEYDENCHEKYVPK